MVVLVLIVIGGWELHLRHRGVGITYDNGKELWADKRAMVYEPSDKATVFLGSSRIKYDLDIDTWQRTTGRHAIQLASEGSSPLPTLENLGNDTLFKGKVVVDITEILFFSPEGGGSGKTQVEYVEYYKKRTPAQKASFVLDHAMESQFVFLNEDFLSLNSGLDNLSIPDRPGMFTPPVFPMDFSETNFDRQNKMTDRFVADTNLQVRVQHIWLYIMGAMQHMPPPKENPVPGILARTKAAVDKIRSRGGDVVFIRTPSSGVMWEAEQHAVPRAKVWDALLAYTKCQGYFFTDYPAIDHFICPEWSHLKPTDAVIYTKTLIGLLPKGFAG